MHPLASRSSRLLTRLLSLDSPSGKATSWSLVPRVSGYTRATATSMSCTTTWTPSSDRRSSPSLLTTQTSIAVRAPRVPCFPLSCCCCCVHVAQRMCICVYVCVYLVCPGVHAGSGSCSPFAPLLLLLSIQAALSLQRLSRLADMTCWVAGSGGCFTSYLSLSH